MSHDQAARTILAQLGGQNRLSIMTGAKNFLTRTNGISFVVGLNPGRVHGIIITLNPSDEYTVEFLPRKAYLKSTKAASKSATVDGIQASALRDVIEQQTGLALSLGTMGR